MISTIRSCSTAAHDGVEEKILVGRDPINRVHISNLR